MKTLTKTISAARPVDAVLDFEVLRAEGVRHLENLATEIWTDFNAHDPGITLLEALCYAITDLGYRTQMLPIQDLMASADSSRKAWFEATEILPNEPVTELDFRKILIDVAGVRNAWIEKGTGEMAVFRAGIGFPKWIERDEKGQMVDFSISPKLFEAFLKETIEAPFDAAQIIKDVKSFYENKLIERRVASVFVNLEKKENGSLNEDTIIGNDLSLFATSLNIESFEKIKTTIVELARQYESNRFLNAAPFTIELLRTKAQSLADSFENWKAFLIDTIKVTSPISVFISTIKEDEKAENLELIYQKIDGSLLDNLDLSDELKKLFETDDFKKIINGEAGSQKGLAKIEALGLTARSLDFSDKEALKNYLEKWQSVKPVFEKLAAKPPANSNYQTGKFYLTLAIERFANQVFGHSNDVAQGETFSPARKIAEQIVAPSFDPKSQAVINHIEANFCNFGTHLLTFSEDKKLKNTNALDLNGLQKITLELDENLDPDSDGETVIARVLDRLHAHRGFGEDFLPPVVLQKRPIHICLHLETDPLFDEEKVVAEAIWKMQKHLSPAPLFRDFAAMNALLKSRDGRASVAQIFNGPLLDQGFLDDLETREGVRRTQFFHSDLLRIILETEGVLSVSSLKINAAPELETSKLEEKTVYEIEGGDFKGIPSKAVIDGCESCFKIKKGAMSFEIDGHDLEKQFEHFALLETSAAPDEHGGPEYIDGIFRPDLGDYRSIQFELPAIYCVGDHRPLPSASLADRAKARHLQAYLAFFDQILASYLAQLQRLRQLLVVDQDPAQPTRSLPSLLDLPGIRDLIYGSEAQHVAELSKMAEDSATQQKRANAALDHVIARFGEQFSAYVATLLRPDAQPEDNAWQLSFDQFLAKKAAFLREIATLGSDRGRAYNYRKFNADRDLPAVWNTANVAGLHRRVSRLVGFDVSEAHSSLLVDPPFRLDLQKKANKKGASVWHILLRIRPEMLDSLNENPDPALPWMISPPFATQAEAQKMHNLLAIHLGDAGQKARFEIEEINDDPDRSQAQIWIKDELGAWLLLLRSAEKCRDEAEELLAEVQKLTAPAAQELEGFHLLEHILLRPNDAKDHLLQLSLGSIPEETPADPYSFWLTVVAPTNTARLANLDFRHFFEQTLRTEAPAHLAIRFCYLEKTELFKFEAAFKNWMFEKARCRPDDCHVTDAANALIDFLNKTTCSCAGNQPATDATCCEKTEKTDSKTGGSNSKNENVGVSKATKKAAPPKRKAKIV